MLMTTVSTGDPSAMAAFLMEPDTVPPLPAVPRETVERDLIARLQRGEEAAFEVLVRQYGGAMLAVTRRMLRNDDDAQEAVQEAFLQALRALPGFRAEARLSTWLHRIAVNAALMRLRSSRRRREVVTDDLQPHFDADGHHVEAIQALPVSVETALASAQTRACVRACVAQLPERHRTVIVLRDIEEMSTVEAAEALGITENALKIRLHRAHQALRTLLVRELRDGAE
jgi:RNA polymerase sigma-70 factor (ECF subfamily)